MKKLSETELQIMNILREVNAPISQGDLLVLCNDIIGKRWERQTLYTFLTRLIKKGYVKSELKGKVYLFSPSLTTEECKKAEAKSFLDSMYQGSVKNFLVALYGEQVSGDEIEELKDWLSEK